MAQSLAVACMLIVIFSAQYTPLISRNGNMKKGKWVRFCTFACASGIHLQLWERTTTKVGMVQMNAVTSAEQQRGKSEIKSVESKSRKLQSKRFL